MQCPWEEYVDLFPFFPAVVCSSIEHLHYFDAHMQKGLFLPSRTETSFYCFMVKM